MIFTIFVLSVSLSIDALGIGFSYGARGIVLRRRDKVITGMITCLVMWLSMEMGKTLLRYCPAEVLQIIGTAILILMGIVYIRRGLMQKEEAFCDLNRSKVIEWWELLLLSFALSGDAVSAGIAVTAIGMHNLWLPLMTGMMQTIFLETGNLCYQYIPEKNAGARHNYGILAGVLLLFIGILRII